MNLNLYFLLHLEFVPSEILKTKLFIKHFLFCWDRVSCRPGSQTSFVPKGNLDILILLLLLPKYWLAGTITTGLLNSMQKNWKQKLLPLNYCIYILKLSSKIHLIRIGSDDRKAVSHALHLNLLSYFRVTLAVFVMVSLSWELDYIYNGILLWVGEDISQAGLNEEGRLLSGQNFLTVA